MKALILNSQSKIKVKVYQKCITRYLHFSFLLPLTSIGTLCACSTTSFSARPLIQPTQPKMSTALCCPCLANAADVPYLLKKYKH